MGEIAKWVIGWARAQHLTLDTLIAAAILILTLVLLFYAFRSDESQKELLRITRKMAGAFPSIVFEASKPSEEARLKCSGLLRNTGKARTTVTGYVALFTDNGLINQSIPLNTALLPGEVHEERFEVVNSQMEDVRSGRVKLHLLCHMLCTTADGNKEEKDERREYRVRGNVFVKG